MDEEEDFPADWKGEVDEEDDDDEGFAITLGDTRPRYGKFMCYVE